MSDLGPFSIPRLVAAGIWVFLLVSYLGGWFALAGLPAVVGTVVLGVRVDRSRRRLDRTVDKMVAVARRVATCDVCLRPIVGDRWHGRVVGQQGWPTAHKQHHDACCQGQFPACLSDAQDER